MSNALKLIAAVIALVGIYANPASAASTLTLTKSDGEVIRLSMQELMDMPTTEITTSSPWTEGVQSFRGVSFDLLFETYGFDAQTVRISALNDYNVIVPVDALREDGAILTYHINGAAMSVREKGPFWVIFPYDSDERYQTDTYWAYSVWQVKSIDEAD